MPTSASLAEVSVFASTAEFYRRYRSGVPADVAELLSRSAPHGSPRRLLDVGTGTGCVIHALLPHFDEAIGVDLDVDLLTVARDELSTASSTKPVDFIEAPAETFTLSPGWTAHLVTVCRAFHWFDRPAFLSHIVDFMAPGGTLAILGDQSIWAGGDAWKERTREVIQEVLGEARRAGSGRYERPARSYEQDILEADFTGITAIGIPVQRTRTIDSVIGLLHSTSFASPAVLGSRLEEFDSRIRDELAPLVDAAGLITDHNEFGIYTATRP